MPTATQADYTVTPAWADLAAAQTATANVSTQIQNKGTGSLQVVFGGASAPVSDNAGFYLKQGEVITGTAANIWVRASGGGKLVAQAG